MVAATLGYGIHKHCRKNLYDLDLMTDEACYDGQAHFVKTVDGQSQKILNSPQSLFSTINDGQAVIGSQVNNNITLGCVLSL
jgi:hypothetical protein